ncbi:16S rRNA (guanine(527)-N(7))-methyltransferase RsmG [Evansella cellulosilytica]|uniref:Ribosomal RNA small subunit methyltransferase G n=1 Tax=Evansella cellulosilytica (strain ATCC 21833 / DSM 2522 / FERM P-1141 / JCM 9156 / N-4) TaxID=649639 RepID=E6TZY5_EVAC2|nr:16S rRNA (guanine(527)-N(7))-methyltransferase RsmG [Evansella cellulosilytica]ADU32551.1 methyltransferase GidB [Evansella cellulosilytica DSM 2522]
MNEEQFLNALLERGIHLNTDQLKQFHDYYELLVEWNEKMNLTAITDKEDVYLKHFFDSVSVSFYHDFKEQKSIVDVGAGAGFPSIPLKICYPHLKVTIVDSLNKRITFLNALAEKLSLKEVSFYHDRAEDFGKKKEHRETYDTALARAVARLPVLAELCMPLVKQNGYFYAMKGAGAKGEIVDAKKAISTLGGELISEDNFVLPKEESERYIIAIKKLKSTPKKYPRKPGLPNKQPL